MKSLQHRNRQPELMDDPLLDEQTHRRALAGLRRVNWWSRTDAAVWKALKEAAAVRPVSSREPLRILDIASGGGDLAIRLARRFEAAGIPVVLDGCDISPLAVDFATRQAHAAQVKNLRFFQHDILRQELPSGGYDVAMCSLFLHHLDEQDAVRLMATMQQTARHMVIVDDLRRTAIGYWLAWIGCRVLTRCHVVHQDGPMSVEGAFTNDEVLELAGNAGLRDVRLRNHWPQRFVLTGRPLA